MCACVRACARAKQQAREQKQKCSQTGTRTRVCWVRASYPNHLDYLGSLTINTHHHATLLHTSTHHHTLTHARTRSHTPRRAHAPPQHNTARRSTSQQSTHTCTRREHECQREQAAHSIAHHSTSQPRSVRSVTAYDLWWCVVASGVLVCVRCGVCE